jgi:hypothetical protein
MYFLFLPARLPCYLDPQNLLCRIASQGLKTATAYLRYKPDIALPQGAKPAVTPR